METRLILFIATIILYIAFIVLAKKGKMPKVLTPNADMGVGSKIGYSLFGILVCYVVLRVLSQQ
jgi:hypothetical protein